jgi:hypothetical protein
MLGSSDKGHESVFVCVEVESVDLQMKTNGSVLANYLPTSDKSVQKGLRLWTVKIASHIHFEEGMK